LTEVSIRKYFAFCRMMYKAMDALVTQGQTRACLERGLLVRGLMRGTGALEVERRAARRVSP